MIKEKKMSTAYSIPIKTTLPPKKKQRQNKKHSQRLKKRLYKALGISLYCWVAVTCTDRTYENKGTEKKMRCTVTTFTILPELK